MKPCALNSTPSSIHDHHGTHEFHPEELPIDAPDATPTDAPEEPGDLDDLDPASATTQGDDGRWEVYISDDDELDPQPDPDDFGESWDSHARYDATD